MNTYRLTRNSPYNAGSPGHSDLDYRQGYYIEAAAADEAITQMEARFPEDYDAGFTCELWKIDCPVCGGKGYLLPHYWTSEQFVETGMPVTCDLCQGQQQVELTEAKDYYSHI